MHTPTRTCAPAPPDKRAFGKAVGDELLQRHGKKRYYPLREIRAALRRRDLPLDLDCWAYAAYASPEDFRQHHLETGEVCDYATMKSEMFAAMTDGASTSWFDLDMSWLEWPDFDFSSLFDFFDF